MEVAVGRWVADPRAHAAEIKEFLRSLPGLIKEDIKTFGNYCCALEIVSGLTIGELLGHLVSAATGTWMEATRVTRTCAFCTTTTSLLQRMWEMSPVSMEAVMCFFQDVEFTAVVREDRSAALLAECVDMAPDAGWQRMCQEVIDIRRLFMSDVIRNQFITSAVFSAISLWQCRQTAGELREVQARLSRDVDKKLTGMKSRLDKAEKEFNGILDKFEQDDQTDPIMLLDINMLTSDLKEIRHDLVMLRRDVSRDRRDVCSRRSKHLIAMIPCAVGVAGAAANLPLAFAVGVGAGYKALSVAGLLLNGGALAGNVYCVKKCQDTISLIDDRLSAIAEYQDRVTNALERAHELQQKMEQHARQQERAQRSTNRRAGPCLLA